MRRPTSARRARNERPGYFLTSERLGFRPWTEEDLPLALDLWGDPRVTRLIEAAGGLSPAQVRDRLVAEIAMQREHGVQYWPVFLLATGEHVGCCGLCPHDPAGQVLEIGFHIRSALWGRGYAREAALAVMAHAFGTLSAGALFAGHHPENEASRRLLGKLGFRYTHDEPYAPTGREHPSYLLTAEEYARREAGGP